MTNTQIKSLDGVEFNDAADLAAYEQGQDAAFADSRGNNWVNPYPKDSQCFNAWYNGFNSAKRSLGL